MSDALTPTSRPPRRVVIAEDEALIRMDLAEMLTELGCEVVGQAADGDAALAMIQEKRPDLAVLDVRMPKQDGISVAAQVAADRICAVIILTAVKEQELVQRATEAGAMNYLTKPFDKEKLMPAVEIAVSRFEEARDLAREVDDLTERMEVRKLVERAKGILMESFGMGEPDAFRWIQRSAMDKRVTSRQVAELIISEADNLAKTTAESESESKAGTESEPVSEPVIETASEPEPS